MQGLLEQAAGKLQGSWVGDLNAPPAIKARCEVVGGEQSSIKGGLGMRLIVQQADGALGSSADLQTFLQMSWAAHAASCMCCAPVYSPK